MSKQIIVTNCHECPLSRVRTVREGAFCGHTDSTHMSVRHNNETIHPQCPLDDHKTFDEMNHATDSRVYDLAGRDVLWKGKKVGTVIDNGQ